MARHPPGARHTAARCSKFGTHRLRATRALPTLRPTGQVDTRAAAATAATALGVSASLLLLFLSVVISLVEMVAMVVEAMIVIMVFLLFLVLLRRYRLFAIVVIILFVVRSGGSSHGPPRHRGTAVSCPSGPNNYFRSRLRRHIHKVVVDVPPLNRQSRRRGTSARAAGGGAERRKVAESDHLRKGR